MDGRPDLFKTRMAEAEALMEKTNKCGMLVVQQAPVRDDGAVLFPRVRESISNILVFLELSDPALLGTLLAVADGRVYGMVVDVDRKHAGSDEFIAAARAAVRRSRLFTFSDYAVWADSAASFIAMAAGPADATGPAYVAGDDTLALLTALGLLQLGYAVRVTADSGLLATLTAPGFPWRAHVAALGAGDAKAVRLVAGAAAKRETVGAAEAEAFADGVAAYDVGIGNFSAEAVQVFKRKGGTVYRHDNRAGISTLVTKLLETDDLQRQVMGSALLGSVKVVAGGIMGDDGAVVVDAIGAPEYVIGVADGAGRLKAEPYPEADRAAVRFVQELIDYGDRGTQG